MKTTTKTKRPAILLRDGKPEAVVIEIESYLGLLEQLGETEQLAEIERMIKQRVLLASPENSPVTSETALLSEQALAEDWNKPEEEEAWSHLQPAR